MVKESQSQETFNEGRALSSLLPNTTNKLSMNLSKGLLEDEKSTDSATVKSSDNAAVETRHSKEKTSDLNESKTNTPSKLNPLNLKKTNFKTETSPSDGFPTIPRLGVQQLDTSSRKQKKTPSGQVQQPQFQSGQVQQPQFQSGQVQQPQFQSGQVQQPQFQSGQVQQPQFPSGQVQQPQFPSGQVQQPQFPSGQVQQPRFPSGQVQQPRFPSGQVQQPQFPSGQVQQPQFPSGQVQQPQFPSGQVQQPSQDVTTMYAMDDGNLDVQSNIDLGRDIGGDYEIGEQLGRGGCAIVYEGWRRSDNLHVAVKVLQLPTMIEAKEAALVKRRFNREAQLIASLNEEHIVKCVDYGSLNGVPCMVLEFVSGEPLDNYLANYGALPVGYALGIVRQLLLALEASHQQGIIHRDIKPSNIMMFDMPPPYEIRVLDFGISTVMEGFEQDGLLLTQQGSIRGTPAYMAPELFTGETRASVQSDLYAVGLVLLETLTAEVAFYGETFVQTAYKHVNSQLEIPDFIEPSLANIILKCCEKETQSRYHSARDVINDLDACTQRAINYEEKYEKRGGKLFWGNPRLKPKLLIAGASILGLSLLGFAAYLYMPSPNSNAHVITLPIVKPVATPVQFIVLTPSARDIHLTQELVYQAWEDAQSLLPSPQDTTVEDSAPARTTPRPSVKKSTKGGGGLKAPSKRVKDNTTIPSFLLK